MKLNITLKQKSISYNIEIGYNFIDKLKIFLKNNFPENKIIIFCDSNIRKLYSQQILSGLRIKNNSVFSFQSGEKSKNNKIFVDVQNQLLKNKFDRNSILIAIGGGVTGDLGGFIAATYYRGIPFIQVPTSLLAMVDSSIGGKVGINNDFGKNLIGVFHQPEAVFIDLNFLKNLIPIHFLNGLTEIIKIAAIKDKKLFEFLEKNVEKILRLDNETIERIIYQSCKNKLEVVKIDEKETGLRKILNYGHTIGHTLERITNYSMLHGYAISFGMLLENFIAYTLNVQSFDTTHRIKSMLNAFGLPTEIRIKPDLAKIEKLLSYDKKTFDGIVNLSFPKELGKPIYNFQIIPEEIIKILKEYK